MNNVEQMKQELALIEQQIELGNAQAEERYKFYQGLHDRKRELERQVSREIGKQRFDEMPEAFRVMFNLPKEGDWNYRLGDYENGLLVSFDPAGYDGTGESKIFVHMNMNRITDAASLLDDIAKALE